MVLHIKAILDRLGLDFGESWAGLYGSWRPSWLQLGAQERSRAAQERPRAAQDRPRTAKSRPRQPKSAQDGPGAAQEMPKTVQEPPKRRPRCSGAAQDSSKTCPDPPQNQRITHDLKRTPNFTPQSFRTSFHATKRPTSKTSGGGTPPKGGFNNQDDRF